MKSEPTQMKRFGVLRSQGQCAEAFASSLKSAFCPYESAFCLLAETYRGGTFLGANRKSIFIIFHEDQSR
jgi:hypothetical protein